MVLLTVRGTEFRVGALGRINRNIHRVQRSTLSPGDVGSHRPLELSVIRLGMLHHWQIFLFWVKQFLCTKFCPQLGKYFSNHWGNFFFPVWTISWGHFWERTKNDCLMQDISNVHRNFSNKNISKLWHKEVGNWYFRFTQNTSNLLFYAKNYKC